MLRFQQQPTGSRPTETRDQARTPSRRSSGLLLCVAALGSLTLLTAHGTEDVETWRVWMSLIESLGLREGFAHSGGIYPPATFVWLYGVTKAAALAGLPRFLALKLSLAFALLLTSALLWAWSGNATLAVATYLALCLNGVALGYTDAYFAPPLILSLWALARGQRAAAGALLAAAFLVKWQPLILAPFFLIWVAAGVDRALRPSLRRVTPFLLACLGVVALAYAGFGRTLVASLGDALTHLYLSGNALNLNWVLGYVLHWLRPETFGALTSGPAALRHETLLIASADPLLILPQRIVFAACYIACLMRVARPGARFREFVRFSLLAFLAYCMLSTGVHENHFFAAELLAAVLVCFDETSWSTFLVLAIVSNLNLWVFYGLRGRPPQLRGIVGISVALAVANVGLFAALFVSMFRSNARDEPRTAPA